MAAIGSGINATLGRQDFSGITQGGQMMAQGILAGGQGIARGIEAAGQGATDAIKMYQQNKLMTGVQISKFEAAMQSDNDGSLQQALQGSPDAAKLVQKMAKNGNLNLKEASQLGAFVDTFQIAKQRERAALMDQQKLSLDQEKIGLDKQRLGLEKQQTDINKYRSETERLALEGKAEDIPVLQRNADAAIKAMIDAGQIDAKDYTKQASVRAELLSNGGQIDNRYYEGGTWRSKDGGAVVAGVRHKGSIGRFVDGKFEEIDQSKYEKISAGDANMLLGPEAFKAEADKVKQIRNELFAIKRYADSVGGIPAGIDKLTTAFSMAAKTAFDPKKPLTQEERALGSAKAYQERLLGALRTTVLGPGVMTEIDALRLVRSMGGDINSIFTNPALVKERLTEMFNEKAAIYNASLGVYNAHVAKGYKTSGYSAYDPIDLMGQGGGAAVSIPDGFTPAEWNTLTPEEQSVFSKK